MSRRSYNADSNPVSSGLSDGLVVSLRLHYSSTYEMVNRVTGNLTYLGSEDENDAAFVEDNGFHGRKITNNKIGPFVRLNGMRKDSMTICFWAKYYEGNGHGWLICLGNETDGNLEGQDCATNFGNSRSLLFGPLRYWHSLTSGQICYITVCSDTTGVRLYLDGLEVSRTSTTWPGDFNYFSLRYPIIPDESNSSACIIRDVKLYNRSLSADDVQRLYLNAKSYLLRMNPQCGVV